MIGDGSFRYTAQEVATMIGQGLHNITIFLINNHGYLIETVIHDGPYNYYKNWDYAGLMNVLNAGWRGMAHNVQGVEIPQCGHLPPEEQPEAVNSALLTFLKGWSG
jgi:TPP-dependent 2-oxoacid decarboxylase